MRCCGHRPEGGAMSSAPGSRLRRAMAAAEAIIADAAAGDRPTIQACLSAASDLAAAISDRRAEADECRRQLAACRQSRMAAGRYRAALASVTQDRRRG